MELIERYFRQRPQLREKGPAIFSYNSFENTYIIMGNYKVGELPKILYSGTFEEVYEKVYEYEQKGSFTHYDFETDSEKVESPMMIHVFQCKESYRRK